MIAINENEISSSQETEEKTDVPKEKKKLPQPVKDILSFLRNIILIILGAWILLTYVIGIYIQNGADMHPKVEDGDLIFFFRFDTDYLADDVVTFEQNGTRYTSRCIAVGGDVVDITEAGQLEINGNVQQEEVYYATYQMESSVEFPYEVPQDSIFVLGDFRTSAVDSRVFGALPKSEVDGTVFTLLRRRSL